MGPAMGPTVATNPVLGTDFMASVKNVRRVLKPRCPTMGWPTSGVPAPCTGTDAGWITRGEEDGFGGSIDRSIDRIHDLVVMNSDHSRAWRDHTRTDPQKFLHVQRSTVDLWKVGRPSVSTKVAARAVGHRLAHGGQSSRGVLLTTVAGSPRRILPLPSPRIIRNRSTMHAASFFESAPLLAFFNRLNKSKLRLRQETAERW